jgi:hypothetical protein
VSTIPPRGADAVAVAVGTDIGAGPHNRGDLLDDFSLDRKRA